MQEAENALTCLSSSDYELSKISTTACLTLLWQFGDRQYHAKRWLEAADWFLIGGLVPHPANEAATYYVALLIAVRQGLEDEAIRAAEDMVNASNFNRKMLLLATSLANESGMKTLLLSVLEALLKSLQTRESLEVDLEAITLVRCIIRLVLKLLVEPASNMAVLVPVLIGHFSTAKSLVEAMGAKKNAALVAKDISWLWRTAYNCAVQGCSQWENSEEKVCDLFDIARQLLEVYSDSVLADADQEVYTHIIYASFAAVAGRVFAIRHVVSNDVTEQATRLRTIYGDITSCKKRIQGVIDNEKLLDNKDLIQTASFVHVLRVFETEIACQLKDWTRALDVVQELIRSDALAVNTFEAIADILWVEKDCPTEVLFTALEAILHASLDRATLSVEKFSRWMRAICTILLSRNSAADRAKAIRYVEQAVNVLEDQSTETDSEETYPLDERQWLLGTSYNTGVECLHASLLDEAKRWFEASTTVCRFVPDGENRAEKISETYAQLLARYSSSMAPPNS
ncbi:hypothetical protein A0H81_00254 [Grifola frondosa]|uniref:Protein ZIP4 homolog n=1 Tax=Grifola frondosa TaxID=5627 RepID=A0A1C7MQK8_GRIFR|nr:hypothetical protein A0H81_00254 [Grifola frondosa]